MNKRLRFIAIVIFGLVPFFSFAQENCSNGIDDDGDGVVDCADGDCQFAANIEKGCNCADDIDNDGDGVADEADGDCASYYGLTFGGAENSCSGLNGGGSSSGAFDFIEEPATSGQNTVDTQSKVAIGDVNCDGIPDVVTTSKWNQTIRVVATADNEPDGSDEGDIIQDFKTPGSKIFPQGNFFFELEILIADIDGSCPVEIYSIVSKRKNANSEPEGYYLVGFRANPSPSNSDLVPLFDAVYLGPDRPGSLGIADFDCDGEAEIFLKDQIYDAETGELLADGDIGDWDTEVNSAPIVADILPGGTQEIVSGNIIFSVPTLSDGSTQTLTPILDMNALGSYQWYPKELFDGKEYGTTNFSSTSVADVNNDGNIDIVLSGALGAPDGPTAVFFWDVTNGTVDVFLPPDDTYPDGWPWGTSRPNLGDLDGDGDLEVTFVAGDKLWALDVDENGNWVEFWAQPRTINDSRSGIISTTVYDFDNDGNPELVYRDSQQLVIVDGATGQNVLWSTPCQSHTLNEGPLIADVNGDGATDLCATCNFSNTFDINDPIQQQALGELRCFFSGDNSWLPTRQVWNQQGYNVVNIGDDLSVPCPVLDMTVEFVGDCDGDGIETIQRPLNTFMNQVPTFDSGGCPYFPAPDISFVGDDPTLNPGDPGYVDPTDPNYFPAVSVIPPTCGDLGIEVAFNIINSGSLIISADLDVSFWENNPTIPVDTITGEPATLLHTTVLQLAGLNIGDTLSQSGITFDYSGEVSTLYIVLNDDGTEFPLDLSVNEFDECFIDNNIYAFPIVPDPFTVEIEKISDNTNCDISDPEVNTGELRAVVKRNGVEVSDLSPYGFQWYIGPDTTTILPAADGGNTDRISGLANGDYSLVVTNLEKGCASLPITETIIQTRSTPEVSIVINSHQTNCVPPNGELEVIPTDGDYTGLTFDWRDDSFTSLGITGAIASDLPEGGYAVIVSRNGCDTTLQATINAPAERNVTGTVIQDVIDCSNLQSGEVTASAVISGVIQDPNNFTFEWYFYDEVNGIIGSLLPPGNGTGPTRTGLDVGFYAVIAIENASGCQSINTDIVEVKDSTVFPVVTINELTPQTSCDPNQPNGRLEAIINGGDNPSNYTIEWFVGDNTLPANLHTSTSGVNGEIAENVGGGGVPYTVKVTNVNNCFTTNNYVISENINVPVITVTKIDNTICDPALATSDYNGSLTVTSLTFDGVAIPLPDSNYEFTWRSGPNLTDPIIAVTDANDPVLPNLNGGTYSVVAGRPDLFCESVPVVVQVLNVLDLPNIDVQITPMTTCSGTPNGEATASVALAGGGFTTTGFTFEWFVGNDDTGSSVAVTSGSANETAEQLDGNLGNNTYTVRVTNQATGCISTRTIVIPDESELPVVMLSKIDNTICDNAIGFNGSVTATVDYKGALVTMPDADYEFTWYAGINTSAPVVAVTNNTDPVLPDLGGGYYTVVVENTLLGCISDPQTIEVLDDLTLPTIVLTPTPSTNCDPSLPNGTMSAVVDETASGGGAAVTTGYTFNWYDGDDITDPFLLSGAALPGINGGNTYTVEVINNATGCSNTQSLTLADNSELPVVDLTKIDNTICDGAIGFNGSVTATVDYMGAGVGLPDTDYQFTWYDGGSTADPVIGVTNNNDPVLTGLDGGLYTVTLFIPSLGCLSDPVVIEVFDDFDLPVIVLTPTPSTNCDLALPNGSMSAVVDETATGGGAAVTAGYTFNWYDGDDISDPFLLSGDVLSNINGGRTYTVEVTNDATGCMSVESLTLADLSELPVVSLTKVNNTICDVNIGYDGAVAATVDYMGAAVTLPDADYVFTWYNGSTTADPVIATSTTPSVSGLGSGFYTVTVQISSLGCISDPVTIEVLDDFDLPVIVLTPTPSTNCDLALPNGAMSAVVDETSTGGGAAVTAGYTFNWYDGDDISDPFLLTGDVLSNINGGRTYTVEVTNDATGCMSVQSLTLADLSELPVVSLTKVNNTICDVNIGYDGSVTATVDYMGAAVTLPDADYVFTWYNGSTTADPVIATSTTPSISGLGSGFYTVTVFIPSLGCTSDPVTIEVLDALIFPDIVLTPTPSTNCDPSLPNGAMSAVVDETASGGGAAVTAGYTFNWYDGDDVSDPFLSTGAVLSSINGGTIYTVEVTNDATGCMSVQSLTLADNQELPIISLSKVDNTICDPALNYDGSVTATVDYMGAPITLPDADYVFTWYDGATTSDPVLVTSTGPNLLQVDGGLYAVTVFIPSLGCTSDPVTIEVMDNQYFPDIDIAVTDQTYCVGLSGELLASIDDAVIGGSGDPNDYTFTWYEYDNGTATSTPISVGVIGGTNQEQVTQLPTGYYRVEVERVSSGCINDEIVFVPEVITLPAVTITKNSDLTTCGAPDGELTADVGGVQVGFTFYWYNGNDAIDEDYVINNADAINVDNGNYPDLIPGSYTVVAINNTTGCISPLEIEVVDNITETINIAININTSPSMCGDSDGEMIAIPTVASDPFATFTYEWYAGGPTNTDPIDFFTNPPTFNGGVITTNQTISGLMTGTYTVVVTYNTTGCKEYMTMFLPFAEAAEIIPNVINSTECPYTTGNGTVEFDIDVTNVIAAGVMPPAGDPSGAIDNDNFTLNFYSGANADVLIAGPIELDNPPYTANQTIVAGTGLAPGFYTIELIEDYTGTACPMYQVVEVGIDAQPPVISLVGTVTANTACDVISSADGEFTIDVAQDVNDVTVGTTFDITISPDPNGASLLAQPIGNYTFDQLPPDDYTVTVTASTGCSSMRTFNVPDAPAISEIVDGDVIITSADLCDPSGMIEVTNIGLIGIGAASLDEFEFTWYDNAALTSIVFQAQGDASAVNGGEVLDPVNYASMGPGDYWIVARKTIGLGAGCYSAPFKATVPDVSVDPEITLSATSNTSCTTVVFEGTISIEMNTSAGPGVGASYDYAVSGPNGYIFNGSGNGNALDADLDMVDDDGDDDILANLENGVYTIVATNQVTGCNVTGIITVPKNETPILVTSVIGTDQELCTIDGQAEVVGVSIDGGLTNRPLNEFEYRWYENDPNSAPLEDDFNAVITTETLVAGTGAGEYSAMGAGTYYVKAIRLTGFSPGAGCESPPRQVIINDVHVNPEISLSATSNTSCTTVVFEGTISIEMNTSAGPGVGASYDYAVSGPNGYVFNGSGNGNALDADLDMVDDDGDNDILANLENGVYTIVATNQVTGCSVTGTITVPKNETPILITSVVGTDQELCTIDGQAEVIGVSIDGGLTTRPLNEFEYRWYENDPNSAPLEDDFNAVITTETLVAGTGAGEYSAMGAGTYYVKAIRLTGFSPGAGCESPPRQVIINDVHVNPEITLSATSNTSCTTVVFEGTISIEMNTSGGPGVGASYDYAVNGPNGYIFNGSGNGNALDADLDMVDDDGDGDILANLENGVYTVVATNQVTGCSVTGTITVPKNETPILLTSAVGTDQDVCFPDGQIEVTGVSIDGGLTNRPLNEFEYRWYREDPNSTPLEDDFGTTIITETLVTGTGAGEYSAMGAGTYYVKAIRLTGFSPGAGCESPLKQVIINDIHVNPEISLSATSNTSCTTVVFEGTISIEMNTSAGPGVGASYDYAVSGPNGYVFNGSGNGNALDADQDMVDDDGDGDILANLEHGVYTIVATNQATSCSVTGTITVPKNETPILLTSAVGTDQDVCFPDGQIEVTGVSIDGGLTNRPLNEFEYRWFREDPNSTPLEDDFGTTIITETLVTGTGAGEYSTMGAGTYYVKAIRLTGFSPGAGCESPPLRVDIKDVSVDPTIVITKTANTACDGNFDGTISFNITDAMGPGVGAMYDYVITGPNGFNLVGFGDGDGSSADGDNDMLIDLEDGTYTITATNQVTTCSFTASSTISFNPPPIDVFDIVWSDQDICFPDGRIEVLAVTPGLLTNYTYSWYEGSPNSAPLVDNFGTPIDLTVLEPGTGAGQYPTLGAGTYYVVATRLSGLDPGSGCPSPPFRVDIEDLSTDPVPTFDFTKNTACDDNLANGILTVTIVEADGSTSDPYTYTWDFNGGSLPVTVTQDDSGGNSSVLNGALDGVYTVTIFNGTTGCDIQSSFNLQRDETLSEPNIIDVAIDNPEDCNPTGSATVQSISVGGGAPITDIMRLDTEFSYTWFVGSPDPSNVIAGVTTRYDSMLSVGTYYIEVLSLLTGCTSIPKEINILDDNVIYPDVNISQPIPQISCGDPFSGQLLAVARESDGTVGANYTFTWTTSQGGLIPAGAQNDTPTSSTLSGLPVGRYDVEVLNTTTNCTGTALFIIEDESEDFYPLINSGQNQVTSCVVDNGAVFGKALEIPNYPFAYSYTIEWFAGDNPDFVNDTPLSSANGVSAETPLRAEDLPVGLYTIRITDEITACFSIKTQEITAAQTFPQITIVEENPLINCDPARPNGQLSATANDGQVGGYSFEWYEGTDATGPIISDQNRLIGVLNGQFTVKVINNVSGCFSVMTGEVTDGRLDAPTPTPEVVAHVTNCIDPNGRLTVTVNGETQGYHFQWFDPTGAFLSGNVNVIDLDVGIYSVIAIDNVTGCDSEPATIEILDQTLIPEFAFTTEGSSCDFDTGKAFLTVANDANVAEVRWYVYDESDPENKGAFLGYGTDLLNVPPGVYLAEGTTFEACVGQGVVEVGTVITNYNLVSSDGDGINDNFRIDCITNFPNNNVKIFNRTGVLVYEIDGYDNLDRSFKGLGENGVYPFGEDLPNGTYYYLIDKGDGSKLISGFLELIR